MSVCHTCGNTGFCVITGARCGCHGEEINPLSGERWEDLLAELDIAGEAGRRAFISDLKQEFCLHCGRKRLPCHCRNDE